MEKRETGPNRRLRLRNRAILRRYGVRPDEADAVFDLELAGWTADILDKRKEYRQKKLAEHYTEFFQD